MNSSGSAGFVHCILHLPTCFRLLILNLPKCLALQLLVHCVFTNFAAAAVLAGAVLRLLLFSKVLSSLLSNLRSHRHLTAVTSCKFQQQISLQLNK